MSTPAHLEIGCTACSAKLRAPNDSVGKFVRCPKCGNKFVVKLAEPPKPQEEKNVVELVRRSEHMPRVFISHCHKDHDFIRKEILGFLQDHEIDYWISGLDIATGSQWENAIFEGFNSCDWFMVVVSPNAVNSKWVPKEVGMAYDSKPQRILPVVIGECSPGAIDPRLADLHYADFTKDKAKAKQTILAAIVLRLNKEHQEAHRSLRENREVIDALKDDLAVAAKKQQENLAKLEDALANDGQWSDLVPHGEQPAFRALGERRTPIISLVNLKGGVGKTTLAANIAATWWGKEHRKRVLLIDLDFQASLSGMCLKDERYLRLKQQQSFANELFDKEEPNPLQVVKCATSVDDPRLPNDNAEIVAADETLAVTEAKLMVRWLLHHSKVDQRFLLRRLLHSPTVTSHYDCIIIDCPPRLTATTINALMASDFLLIPTLLADLSIEAVPRLLKWIQNMQGSLLKNLATLGVVVNKTRNRTLIKHEENMLDRLKGYLIDYKNECPVFESFIPTFPAAAMDERFAAHHSLLRPTFLELVNEIDERMDRVVRSRNFASAPDGKKLSTGAASVR